jgi:argininosuccinate lyase
MFTRDTERFVQARKRANVLPLGAGALAGVTYPIDREAVARELGFEAVPRTRSTPSPTATSSSTTSAAALTMVHLSRLAEEMILWASAEFGFVRLDDALLDGLQHHAAEEEPGRGRADPRQERARLGNLVQALTMLKGQPLAYNKDNQEDKEALFDTVDTLLITLA